MGYILLEGGAEFGGKMAEPDRRAMELAGGLKIPVRIIPAAAAPDDNHERAGRNGVRWFENLGASNVSSLPLIDRTSADDPKVVQLLSESKLVYLLGGFTHHLGQSLAGSGSWEAIRSAHEAGAVIAGSSAGAMVLCENYYHPSADETVQGLGMVSGACVLPHHDTFGEKWAPRLVHLLPGAILIGIDEETGMINDGPDGQWQVYGKGEVTLYKAGKKANYGSNQPFELAI